MCWTGLREGGLIHFRISGRSDQLYGEGSEEKFRSFLAEQPKGPFEAVEEISVQSSENPAFSRGAGVRLWNERLIETILRPC